MPETRPVSDQIRFKSSQTGDHNLDTYLEAAEKGGRTVAALLDDIFDANGNVDAGFVSFQVNDTTYRLQYQPGPSTGSAGFIDTNTFLFRLRGAWAANVDYERLDLVTDSDNLYIANAQHNSGPTGVFADTASNWQVVSASSQLIAAIDAKATELENTKSESYYHAFERKSDGSLEWFTGNGPDKVSTYNGFQQHDGRKRHPRVQIIPFIMKYNLDFGTNMEEPSNFARSTSGNYRPHQDENDILGMPTFQNRSSDNGLIGKFIVPYLPRNAKWDFQLHQIEWENSGAQSVNIYAWVQSSDNPNYRLPWGFESRDYDNYTQFNGWYIGYARQTTSNNRTVRAGYTGKMAPLFSAMIPSISSQSEIPVGYNREFELHCALQFSNANNTANCHIRGDSTPFICHLTVEDLDYDLKDPDAYYDGNYNDEYNVWDVRNWHDHAVTSKSVPQPAAAVTRYHQNQVDKLIDDSPARFSETENYYTNDYEINRIGGSDENYHLNGGNLMVRLGEHKYPTLKVKYLVDASNNNTPVFWVNGVKQDTLTLVRGNIYDFEYEGDFTNNGANAQNRFRLSEVADGSHGTDANGDPGTVYQTDITFNSAASVSRIKVTATTPSTLYYFSEDVAAIGGTINVVNDDYLPS